MFHSWCSTRVCQTRNCVMKMIQYFSKTRIYIIFRFNFFDSSFQGLCLTQAFFKKM